MRTRTRGNGLQGCSLAWLSPGLRTSVCDPSHWRTHLTHHRGPEQSPRPVPPPAVCLEARVTPGLQELVPAQSQHPAPRKAGHFSDLHPSPAQPHSPESHPCCYMDDSLSLRLHELR